LHTKRQVEALTVDLFSSESKHEIEELDMPSDVLKGFGYESKVGAMKMAYKFIYSHFPAMQDVLVPPSKPLRIFRFSAKDETATTGTAAAYPIARYSSLVFVRQGLEELRDAQRLQIYHELGHGTIGGTEAFYRSLRWEIVAPFDSFLLLLMIVICFDSGSLWHRLTALNLVLIAHWLRNAAASYTKKMALGASEVYADSLALRHPDFSLTDKWMTRAQNLLKRLEDDMRYGLSSSERNFALFFRIKWLERWISLGYVPKYLALDIDTRYHLAFALYLLAGWVAAPSTKYLHTVFWGLFVSICAGYFLIAQNGWRSNDLLVTLDNILRSRSQVRAPTQGPAPQAGP
jgi:hypothetical protein